MKCVNCGSEIPEKSTICFECGAEQTWPSSVVDNKQEKRVCKNCGAILPEGFSVCYSCGVDQNASTDLSVSTKDLTNKSNPKCIHCGANIPEGATVCYSCGQTQSNSNTGIGGIIQGGGKSKAVTAILAILFGTIGGHDFYLGKTKIGIIKIILGILSGGIISGVWSLIDFVRMLTGNIATDANGNPLS